jgi:hypothetical protein
MQCKCINASQTPRGVTHSYSNSGDSAAASIVGLAPPEPSQDGGEGHQPEE